MNIYQNKSMTLLLHEKLNELDKQEHKTSAECWINAGLPSMTLAQH